MTYEMFEPLFLDSLSFPTTLPLRLVPVQLPEFTLTSAKTLLGRARSSYLLVYSKSGTVVESVHEIECCHVGRVHLYDFHSSCQSQ